MTVFFLYSVLASVSVQARLVMPSGQNNTAHILMFNRVSLHNLPTLNIADQVKRFGLQEMMILLVAVGFASPGGS